MTVYVNYRYQGDTVTVAELPSTVEAHRWIASHNNNRMGDHQRPYSSYYYVSQRASKEWREAVS